jgi:hypothetical protein
MEGLIRMFGCFSERHHQLPAERSDQRKEQRVNVNGPGTEPTQGQLTDRTAQHSTAQHSQGQHCTVDAEMRSF